MLQRRPQETLRSDDVRLCDVVLPLGGEGTVRVRNVAMSLEPYLYGRLSGRAGYEAAYNLGEPLRGPAVGVIEDSGVQGLPVGAHVLHDYGWRDRAVLSLDECTLIDAAHDPKLSLGVLGLTGMTAWVGLRKVAQACEGDTVFISSAAGAVGSAAVQLALATGCTVIGSAGSRAKCESVLRLGAHAVFNYRDGSIRDQLRASLERVGKTGIDVYFDNVGGEQLEAAIREMAVHGRIALCGMTSAYSASTPQPGPSNLLKLVWNRVRMEGFLLRDHRADKSEFLAEMSAAVEENTVRSLDTVLPGGLAVAWESFSRMREGAFVGKVIIDL
ncbi:zinc-binding dehydrogenase [Leucobacter exalbidus]|uniref:zinc-binding dehydrogenase n=1 Tax=Leucobacter exalbidus TaxID=662960 RepID=UPI001AE56A90